MSNQVRNLILMTAGGLILGFLFGRFTTEGKISPDTIKQIIESAKPKITQVIPERYVARDAQTAEVTDNQYSAGNQGAYVVEVDVSAAQFSNPIIVIEDTIAMTLASSSIWIDVDLQPEELIYKQYCDNDVRVIRSPNITLISSAGGTLQREFDAATHKVMAVNRETTCIVNNAGTTEECFPTNDNGLLIISTTGTISVYSMPCSSC